MHAHLCLMLQMDHWQQLLRRGNLQAQKVWQGLVWCCRPRSSSPGKQSAAITVMQYLASAECSLNSIQTQQCFPCTCPPCMQSIPFILSFWPQAQHLLCGYRCRESPQSTQGRSGTAGIILNQMSTVTLSCLHQSRPVSSHLMSGCNRQRSIVTL